MRAEVSSIALPALALALLLGACTPAVVKQSAPPIGKTLGKLDAPSEEQLPIIASEPIAADPQKAAEQYRELLKLQPDADTAREATRRLADLQVQIEDTRGNTEDSTQALREAVTLYQNLLRSDADADKQDRVLYQLARAQQNLGEVEAAVTTLRQLSERFPDSPLTHDGYFRGAELLFLRGRYAEAADSYRNVMALGERTPFFMQAQYKYGWSLYKQSRHEEAIAVFLDILERDLPPNTPVDPEQALAGVAASQRDLAQDSLRVVSLSLIALGGGEALNGYLARNTEPRFYPTLYSALGKALLERRRYTDAAQAYAAFVERYGSSELAPAFQSQVIAAYDEGGFTELVVHEKERYALTYDPQAPYWRGVPPTPEVMTALRGHLEDLARHRHAQAQARGADARAAAIEDFLAAAGWYERILSIYPQDPQAPDISLLLGDALLDGGRTLQAAERYTRTAYDYPGFARAGEAAHAAVLAYRKYADEVPASEHAAALRPAVDASLRFADSFPEHPQRTAVLTRSAQDLYTLQAYDEAIAVAARVLQATPAAAAPLRRIAWNVTGSARYAQNDWPAAEAAFTEELRLLPADDALRNDVLEQLAASIYRQGEAAREAGDIAAAATHFLRVGQAAPQASIRAAAEYDGAAMLMQQQDWARAAGVLETFLRLFPGHALEAEADKQLALAYREDGRPLQAAQVYTRIAARDTEALDTRREAAWLAATLYDEAPAAAPAAQAYERYLAAFPQPADRALQARERLAALARAAGDQPRLEHWLRELVAADTAAGATASERSRALAAQSSLELGRAQAARARALPLSLPVERSLPARNAAVDGAIGWFDRAAGYGFADIATASTYEIGQVYEQFARALIESERPRRLSELEREQYDLLLEEQAYPFEERAIQAHEANLARIRNGHYDEWIARSAETLARMVPARYGKLEQGEERYERFE